MDADGGGEICIPDLGLLLVAMLTTHNLLDLAREACDPHIKGGRVMAEAMGVVTSRSRMVIFVIAALLACASLAGMRMQRFREPDPVLAYISASVPFMAVVGGAGHVGAIVGAGVITVIEPWLRTGCPACSGATGNFETTCSASRWCWCCSAPVTACGDPRRKLVPVRARKDHRPRRRARLAHPMPKAGERPRGEERDAWFGGLIANKNASLEVRGQARSSRSSVLNGAGKSDVQPDPASIR